MSIQDTSWVAGSWKERCELKLAALCIAVELRHRCAGRAVGDCDLILFSLPGKCFHAVSS